MESMGCRISCSGISIQACSRDELCLLVEVVAGNLVRSITWL